VIYSKPGRGSRRNSPRHDRIAHKFFILSFSEKKASDLPPAHTDKDSCLPRAGESWYISFVHMRAWHVTRRQSSERAPVPTIDGVAKSQALTRRHEEFAGNAMELHSFFLVFFVALCEEDA
jgi:hypothetical protein